MDALLIHAAFPTFLLCTVILVIKMLMVGHLTAYQRFKHKSFLNSEDAAFIPELDAHLQEHPDTERWLRAHRNDLESTVPFFTIGLLFLLVGPTVSLANGLFISYTALRVFFSFAYVLKLQPWRSLAFILAEVILFIMMYHIGSWALSH